MLLFTELLFPALPCPAEFLFLLWGVYLCYAVRSVLAAFHEPRYLAAAVYNELLLSALFHSIRYAAPCSTASGTTQHIHTK